ncbi:beta-galactosidase [Sanguibacter hominis ATCC BAA-789]|uniref:Beta-galactosidase n=1 Tax=Sanguibacter hominis ATCC BAA-789 TaxID=1312740 RepID=A0A9X5INW6_9MICO|nr:beta-galactosidase family protein [Sanguibacter hominis]NKX92582.1 beta-galactosidase [Sanguibacter hominis ATCC BAA-789]
MPTFEIGAEAFLLDGRPHQVVSGALHYFRVHPDLWADRIHKARLMGLNTIETYVAWNFHSSRPGEFRTDGARDLGRFLDLVAAEGMHAIVRPGPYICAEWDNGGLPAWLFADGSVGVRTAEPRFLAAVADYYAQLLPVVAQRQVTRGGPVLLVQLENEYGAYGDSTDYLTRLEGLIRANGIDVPLITCDQADDEMLTRGGLPHVHRTATFGSRTTERLETLRRHQPTGPLMCMEFWNGWFDSWGEHHHTATAEQNAHDLDALLAAGGSVNLYMFHGGTNFGLTNGANDKGTYWPITTSYDYDAPLSEHGAVTPKYLAFREVIARYVPVPDELPAPPLPGPELTVDLDRTVPLADVLDLLGEEQTHDHLPTHDELGRWNGFVVYETDVAANDAVVSFAEVRDRAVAHLDGQPLGVLSRSEGSRSLTLPTRAGRLRLLVEDQGRVNYGRRLGEAKGLLGPARTARRTIDAWRTRGLDLDQVSPALATALDGGSVGVGPVAGSTFAAGRFDSVAGRDHFLRLDGWTRGLVWLNGALLGRFSAQGPTRTMYVPGPLVRDTDNHLVVLELQGAERGTARFVAEPDLGHTER